MIKASFPRIEEFPSYFIPSFPPQRYVFVLKYDLDINASHVQSLSNADAIVAFFTNLGYNTESRLTQTPAAMGFSAATLVREINRIERIADHEQGELQVYLIEMK
jgi:hypothetical protein